MSAVHVRKACFPPVVDAATQVLILGSLPGDASLAKAQYYGHPRNQFWPLLAAVLGEDLPAQPYLQRLETLRRRGVGLWDVLATAVRPGSLDTALREGVHNDLALLLSQLPALQAIAGNGGAACRLVRRQLGGRLAPYHWLELPSSSPAYTLPLADKLSAWRRLTAYLPPAATG